MTIHVNSSENNWKKVQVHPIYGKNGFKCPDEVNKTNWLGPYDHNYTFDVSYTDQDMFDLNVTRTDSNEGWNMSLSFNCYPDYSNIFTFIL